MKKIRDILKANHISEFTFVDVGAKGELEYIKEFSDNMCLHAFEPNPDEYLKLSQKYKSDDFKFLTLNGTGLSDHKGRVPFYITNHASMSSLLESDKENYKRNFGAYAQYESWENNISTQKIITIELDTLDNYFKETSQTIDYLKIDTQGSELSILKGGEELIRQLCIQVIKLEVSTIPVYKEQALFSDIDVYLRNNGYSLVDFVTYRDEYQPVYDKRKQQPHFSVCGDAIYVLTNKPTKENAIRRAVILNWLGYAGLSEDMMVAAGIEKEDIQALSYIEQMNHVPVFKRLLKNVTPPVVWQLLKKLWH